MKRRATTPPSVLSSSSNKLNETTTTSKMTLLCQKIIRISISYTTIVDRVNEFLRFLLDRILVCSVGTRTGGVGVGRYRKLDRRWRERSEDVEDVETAGVRGEMEEEVKEEDLVNLKVILLGDCRIGKTSFVIKYVGDDEHHHTCLEMNGLNLMAKTFFVQGARIAFKIWDVGGDHGSLDHVPSACKDAVAILFMFDLTSRCTLRSVIGWYNQARKWNKTAIPILIGTKFDDFIRLPPHLQWTFITQARAYARAMNATLFFSSATHNINVNKIFKFITARAFDLPWTVQRNISVGEPIIDF